MILWMLTSLTLSISFSIILASSPLSLGLWVLALALSISCTVSFIFSSWFALVIFLVYIGGMLVMFAYFTALMPNIPMEMFKMMSALILSMLTIITISLKFTVTNLSLSSEIYSSPIITLYSPMNIPVLLFMALILFFILVAVVKVANIYSGPLRPFN